jgi:hypothetical protein
MSEWRSCVHDFGNAPRPPLFRQRPNLGKGANKINKKEKAMPGGTIPSQYRALEQFLL